MVPQRTTFGGIADASLLKAFHIYVNKLLIAVKILHLILYVYLSRSFTVVKCRSK